MVTVNITVTDDAVQPEIYLGRQGEKQAREIVFDLSALRTKYGTGTATLYHQRSKDPAPYLIGETTGTTLTWTVSETDTVYAGIGYCEFRYTFGTEGLSKSTMFATNVKASLSGDVIIPAALQAWYDALIDYIDTHSGGSVDPADIAAAVEDYMDEHPITESDPTVPSWAKASTKPTYTAAEVGAIAAPSSPASGSFLVWNGTAWVAGQGGDGLTSEIKTALLQLAEKVAYIDNQGSSYYTDLYCALYDLDIVGISAVYTQSGKVYDTDTLDDLKADLVVTATLSDSSTTVLPPGAYTLSGTLTEGTSQITVTRNGTTDTFNVTVTNGYWGTMEFEKGPVAKATSGGIQKVYAAAVIAARARMKVMIPNDGYTFTVTDSSKYNLVVYDPTTNVSTTTITVSGVTYPAYVGGTKSITWGASDSATTDYVWVAFKKMDNTDFTDEELENMYGTVFTVS